MNNYSNIEYLYFILCILLISTQYTYSNSIILDNNNNNDDTNTIFYNNENNLYVTKDLTTPINIFIDINKYIKNNQYYSIRLHTIDALSIEFKIELICNNNNNNENNKINYNSNKSFLIKDNIFSFYIDKKYNIKDYCQYDQLNKYIIFKLSITEISNRILSYDKIINKVNFIFELTKSKLNTDNKLLTIIFDKNLISLKNILFLLVCIVFTYIFVEKQANISITK